MKRISVMIVTLLIVTTGLLLPRSAGVVASTRPAAPGARKVCKTITKKVHGKKKRVKLCKTVKPKPTPTPTPTPTPALPSAGKVVATIALPSLEGEGEIQFGEGSVWVRRNNTIVRIDPGTNTVTATITAPGQYYIGIGEGSVWVSDPDANTVNRVDPATQRVVATIPVGVLPEDFAFTPGAVWVSNHHSGTISRIDPATNTVVATVTVGPAGSGGPEPLAVASGAVWVCIPNVGAVVRIDPQSNSVAATIPIPGGCVDSPLMAADESGVWMPEPNEVVRIDPNTNRVVADIHDGVVDAFGIALGFQSVWVGDWTQGILRIDPQQNKVTAQLSIPGGTRTVNTVTTGAGSVWAERDDQVFRIQPG